MAEENFAAESSGPQRDVNQVVEWPDDLRITGLNLQTTKATLIMQLQLMLRRNMFISPNIALLEREMLGYKLQDKKISQDFVMAFLALTYVVWPHVADEFQLEREPLQKHESVWETIQMGRETRDADREFRSR
jgi:hypothetical protein